MRNPIALFSALLLLAPAASLAGDLASDDQIQQALVGNTVTGVENGKSYTEYYLPDGTLHGLEAEGSYTGHWKIDGGRFCENYVEDSGLASDWDCAHVSIDGNNLIWADGADKEPAKLIKGNPSNL